MTRLIIICFAAITVPAVIAATAVGQVVGVAASAWPPLAVARQGNPFGGACRPVITQGYGPTSFAGEPIIGGVHFHTGIDLACPGGTPVVSVTAGIAHVTTGWGGGFGNNVVVQVAIQLPRDSAPQTYFIRYAHLAAIAVKDGASVPAGALLGWEGSTGFSTGPHLHFEVDRGASSVQNSVNPAPLLEGAR